MKRNILITGANGFIGYEMMKYFIDKGYRVTGLVKEKYRGEEKFAKNIEICDLTGDVNVLNAPDIVIHTAALWANGKAGTEEYVLNNIMGTLNLINFARKKGVKGIIFLGAVSSYGKIPDGVLTEETRHMETDDYGITKLVAERIVRNCGIPNRILILPGVIGMGCHENWLVKTALSLKRGVTITVYNADGLFNNIVDIHSVCEYTNILIEKEMPGTDTFLLASEDKLCVSELVNRIKEEFHSDSQIIWDRTEEGFYIDNSHAVKNGFNAPRIEDLLNILFDEINRRDNK